MSEYISKEAAKDNVSQFLSTHAFVVLPELRKSFDKIPSADVRENIHGEWIFYDEEFYPKCRFASAVHHRIRECSICHHKIADFVGNMDFCPNCGAYMKGET